MPETNNRKYSYKNNGLANFKHYYTTKRKYDEHSSH